jgi:hypothetical protein
MKTIPAILIIAFSTLALASDSSLEQNPPPMPNGGIVGRFQLVSAAVDDSLGNESHKYLFRIDTATGKVWSYRHMLMPINVPGHPEMKTTDVEGWVETTEDMNQSIKQAHTLERQATESK